MPREHAAVLQSTTAMPLTLLKIVRLAVPAVMLYLLLVLFCWASHWCSLVTPDSYKTFSNSFAFFALGALYYFLPLRRWANRAYAEEVGENLATRLTAPFVGDPNVPRNLTWPQVSEIFYGFIDEAKKKSLAVQMQLAYWNGAFWTSAADLRAVSAVGMALLGLAMLAANMIGDPNFDNARAVYGFLSLGLLFLVSIPFSRSATRKQIKIGNVQADLIIRAFRNELRQKLIDAAPP
jgi:hypothetical protein